MFFHNVENKSSQSTPLPQNTYDEYYPAWKGEGNIVKWTVFVSIIIKHLEYENIFKNENITVSSSSKCYISNKVSSLLELF